MERRIQHLFHCSPDTYWEKLFFDEEYNHALFLGELGFESWKVASTEETPTEVRRVIDAVPKAADLPGPLRKLIANGLGYRERGVFDKASRRYAIEVTPASLADRMSIRGVTLTEPVPEGRCNRVYLATVQANIFGVGGMLERRLIEDLEKSYAKAADFSNRWIKERGL